MAPVLVANQKKKKIKRKIISLQKTKRTFSFIKTAVFTSTSKGGKSKKQKQITKQLIQPKFSEKRQDDCKDHSEYVFKTFQ